LKKLRACIASSHAPAPSSHAPAKLQAQQVCGRNFTIVGRFRSRPNHQDGGPNRPHESPNPAGLETSPERAPLPDRMKEKRPAILTSARRAGCDNCYKAVRRGVAPENQNDCADAASNARRNRVGTAVSL